MEELENGKNNEQEIADLKSALNYERSERKRLSKELSSLKSEDDSEEIKKAENEIRAKLKSGKSNLNDDVVEDLMATFGKAQAVSQVKNAKQNIEKEIMELQRNPMYMDIAEHSNEIRNLVKSGLTVEQAYWATVGADKFSNSKVQREKEEEKDQKKALNKERANEGYVETKPAGTQTKEQYSEKERTIADRLGITPEEAKIRSKSSLSLEEILNSNKKFKKGE